MASKDAPAPDIMNVKEIIEFAFGDFEKNTVNFKLVQTILFLIARQLRLLERRVIVEVGPLTILPSDSTLSVTEVKIHATQKKTKQDAAGAKPGVGGATAKGKKGRGTQSSSSDKTSTDKTSSDKTSTDKSAIGKTATGKTATYKTATDKTATDKSGTYKTATDETATDKTATYKTATDKTATYKTATDKTATDKTATYKTGTDKTGTDQTATYKTATDKTATDKTATDKTATDKTATDKTATDKTATDKAATDKTATDKTGTYKTATDETVTDENYTDKTSSDKTSTDKTATDKSSTDKTASDKTSTDKTSSAKTSSDKTSTDKTSTEITTSSAEQTSTDKTSTDKSPSAKTTSTSTDKPSSKTTSSDRTSSSKMTSSGKDAAGRQKPDSYPDILNTLEEQRERELRIIHQRTDSFEETTKTPTPMASVSSLQYEKLLVVQRVPSAEARLRERVDGSRRTPQISVVTQEQFDEVADAVRQLGKKLLPVGTPAFPERAELMEELRKGASLTDAMAALQLSARLEATEKTLGCLISMVTELALKTPGVELDSETRALLGISATWERDPFTTADSEILEGDPSGGGRKTKSLKASKGGKSMTEPSSETAFIMSETAETEMTQAAPSTDAAPESEDTEKDINAFVTLSELHRGSREMYDEMIKKVKTITARTTSTAETAYKISMKLETRLDSMLLGASRMDDLENAVKVYAEQINALDTGLSSQMTNYQEQLTQMQHDLEIGLDTMAEVLGNAGGDNEAIAELHSHFSGLQMDFEMISFRQKELKGAQNSIAYDLENLWREIEMLRDTKSDREEVADALRDKAGICELNGLVSLQQFEAVRGDFQKRIRAAYDKFNNQENIWQKLIDDMVKVLNEKADLIQVYSLKDEIHKYLNRIKDRMQIISDIVGEPKSAMLSKKVFRDTLCLSCGSPAHMDLEEPGKIPALPKFPSARQPGEGTEAESQTKGGGDYGICYPDFPISHPRDPRSHICKRYCGGSHTVVTDGLNRALPGLVVQQVTKTINAEPGTDGKLYLMEEQAKKIPCLACNMPQPSSIAPEPKPQKQAPIDSIDEFGNISLTPPAHEISYN